MTRILLVRHGESEANQRDIFAGHLDVKLTEKGLEQAKLTAEYVAANYKVDKVYGSDLQRAFVTGKTIADRLGLDITPTKEMREVKAGKWDGMVFDDIVKVYPDDFNCWTSDIGKARCTDGESVVELQARVMRELNRIADENEGKTVLVASHATPIRVAVTSVEYDGDITNMNSVPWVSNASVSVIEKDNGKWRVVSLSEDKHLAALRTALPDNV